MARNKKAAERPRGRCAALEAARYKDAAAPDRFERGLLQLPGYTCERGAGIGADRLNRRQTDDDDQGQHNRIFDCGRAIFRYEETLHLQSEILHSSFLQQLRRERLLWAKYACANKEQTVVTSSTAA